MLGQLWVEPELELELELPEDDEPLEEPVPLAPEPVLPLLVLEEGVVVDELVPVLPVVPEVVAALATRAPPARRPEVSAPTASTVRRRICMTSFRSSLSDPVGRYLYGALRTLGSPHSDVGAWTELDDERVTILRSRTLRRRQHRSRRAGAQVT
jgi:hypothetical protein